MEISQRQIKYLLFNGNFQMSDNDLQVVYSALQTDNINYSMEISKCPIMKRGH